MNHTLDPTRYFVVFNIFGKCSALLPSVTIRLFGLIPQYFHSARSELSCLDEKFWRIRVNYFPQAGYIIL